MFLSTIAICEDEKFYRDILIENISKILDKENIIYNLLEYSSGEDLLNDKDNKIDILFLDICLGGLSGMEVARSIREFDSNIEIIFITSMKSYVFEAYEVKAYRYLVKPIKQDLLEQYLLDCTHEIRSKNNIIAIKSKKDTLILDVNEILYIEVVRKHITIYMNEKNYTLEISLKKMEDYLKNYKFFRCHHSYIVNLKQIEQIKGNRVVLKGYEIPVSRAHIGELQHRLAIELGNILY